MKTTTETDSNLILTQDTIRITVREVYGQFKAYPACNQAKLFGQLLNQKTLTRRNLIKIRDMGYDIVDNGYSQPVDLTQFV